MNATRYLLRGCMALLLTAAGSQPLKAVEPTASPEITEPGLESMEPLSAEQLEQIRTLVQRTQAHQHRLRTALLQKQQQLADCYALFELNEEQVAELQEEIIGLQRRLLDSHHAMQRELRLLVGPDRFRVLSRRIERALQTPPSPSNESPQDSRTGNNTRGSGS